MRGLDPRLSRILSILLALYIAAGWPAWPQQTQSAPARPQEAQKAAPPQSAPAAPQTQSAPGEAAPGAEEKATPAVKGATLKGRVIGADRRTPLPAAVVHAVGSDGAVVSSQPADAKGGYSLENLAPGTYILAVSAEDGVFSLENPVGITSARIFRVDLAAVPAEGASFAVPGLTLPPRGFCYIVQGRKPEKATFWRSPKGIVLLGVTAAAAGLILAESGGEDEEEPVSPSAP